MEGEELKFNRKFVTYLRKSSNQCNNRNYEIILRVKDHAFAKFCRKCGGFPEIKVL